MNANPTVSKATAESVPPAGSLPSPHPVLQEGAISLRVFTPADITDRYLRWLVDEEVNRYSRRRCDVAVTAEDAAAYLDGLGDDEIVLAIHHEQFGHVGNIKYGPVDWANRRADISILIGETSVWGQGVGARATDLVTAFLFREAGLNRVEAGSNNPAFIAMVQKLGWRVEGVLRDYVKDGDSYRDHTMLALLRDDWAAAPSVEGD